MTATQNVTETWYEIQYSAKGAGDWFTANDNADTIESARKKLDQTAPLPKFDFRIVKVSRVEEVVS